MTPRSLKTVAIIGNGIIGHGMAQIFASAGRGVVMIGRVAGPGPAWAISQPTG